MKRCPNCGRLELLSAHASCDASSARISLQPNPYRVSSTVIQAGHTPPAGIPLYLEMPARLPLLLSATVAVWRRGLMAAFSTLVVPFAAAMAALVLPSLVDDRMSTQLGVAGLLFLPLWIAAEGVSLLRLSGPVPSEGRAAWSLGSWNTAFRQVPRLAWFHAQILLLMVGYAGPFVLAAWLWPETTVLAVVGGLLCAAWPWARYSLVLPLVLLEGHSVSMAMKRSREASTGHMGRLWRLFAVLLLVWVGGVFLAGRGVVVACDSLGIEGLFRGLLLLSVVMLLPPLLYGPLVAARLVVKEALPRVRFVGQPEVLAVFSERDAAEAVARRLSSRGIAAEVVGGTDVGSLRLLVTDAQVLVAEQDLDAARLVVQTEP